ncbi:hypothetical protein Q9299_07620 [Gemmobacter fulvus]|nr:hypothetical protein [Gemmobacter fulvus]MDQ1848153.1 hypothetical protein [Gemmobacter fulvus]
MATTQPQSQAQQGGTSTPSQQQGQSAPTAPQQGSQPLFRDWASI